MPSRVIREGLLDSQRYWSVTIEARQLFWHLMLLADDFGCVTLAPVFVRRRCFDDAPPNSKIDTLLQHLFDADLIRIYEVNGARYGFIPRFQQRLRIMKSKYPIPPPNITENDDEANKRFNEIRAKHQKMPDTRPTDDGHMTAETNRNESKRREEKGRREEKPPRDWWKTESGIILKMAEMGINPLPGETYQAIKERLFDILNAAKTAETHQHRQKTMGSLMSQPGED